jgi:transposase
MNQKKSTRRQYSPADKVRILRLHYLEGRPISRICEEEGLRPTLFYQWQKVFFENGTAAFASAKAQSQAAERERAKLDALESKPRRKDEVIAEIMEDLVRTKKGLGES